MRLQKPKAKQRKVLPRCRRVRLTTFQKCESTLRWRPACEQAENAKDYSASLCRYFEAKNLEKGPDLARYSATVVGMD